MRCDYPDMLSPDELRRLADGVAASNHAAEQKSRRIKSLEGREAFMRGILEYIAKGADPQAHIVARNALAKLDATP
jgi:hypothetical protein